MLLPRSTRRQMLKQTGMIAAAAALGPLRSAAASPVAQVEPIRVISRTPQLYCGWPTLTRLADGSLRLVYSGGREGHVCPFGRVEMMASFDGGGSWTWPRVLLDGDLDDRDAGILETPQGTLLVTTFTSLAYEAYLERGEAGGWPPERLEAWRAARDRLSPEQRRAELGTWMIRSTDRGRTWSAPYDCGVDSPHGPIALSDGRLLYPGKELWKQPKRVGVCVSEDDGQTWRWLAEIPARPGDNPEEYHELHGVEAAGGRIVVHIRNHNKQHERETLQTESTDGGRTWSVPQPIGVWGLPSHLLRLKDGALLMTYGYRRKPFGNRACLSVDGGQSWSEPLTVSDDGTSGDLGYPSTVELDDGTLVTVWYELRPESTNAVLRQARWRIAGR